MARRADLRPLWRLAPHIAAHRGDALLGLLFLLLSSLATLCLTVAGRTLVDYGFRLQTSQALFRSFLMLSGVVVVFALATALRIYFVNKLGERVVVDLRRAAYRHILMLDVAQVVQVRTGELLSRITTDMTIVERMVGVSAPIALRCVISLTGSVILLLAVSPHFSALIMVLMPVGLAPLFISARRLRRLSSTAQDRFAEAMGNASEGLEGLETVLAFGQEKVFADRFGDSLETAFTASRRFIRARVLMTGMLIMLLFLGMLVVLYPSAEAVFVKHQMTGGVLLQLLALSMLAASSARELGEVSGDIFKASGALVRISEVLDMRPSVIAPQKPAAMLPRPARGEIEFRNVGFAYPGRADGPALQGFSLHVRPGERVALVGPSGAGKSTVFRLLLRFYDPDEGSVSLDGVDLRSADPREVRARMALVAQEAALFSGSAGENIRFGQEGVGPEEVRRAAAAAQADFLNTLPEGLDTCVGERARTLSGGQRQRLSIARALVRDAPILLLDEATSALDAENERLVQQAIHGAMDGRTSLVIAHRLATVMEADRIIVMDRGRVVEEGSHAELTARGGLYARLARLQFAASAA